MCGIIGIIGKKEVVPLLVDGLKRLEYRGYDSAGIAVISDAHTLERRRAKGKISELESLVASEPVASTVGIGHTRWATHGVPNQTNAHPHMTEKLAVVHNGIIENFQELREQLTAKGYQFESQTDTEIIPLLIDSYLAEGNAPYESVVLALKQLEGAFALGIIFAGHEDLMIAARQGSPLAIGYGDGEMYLGSDAIALAPFTSRLTYMEDGDVAVLSREDVVIYDQDGNEVTRQIKLSSMPSSLTGKGNYRHFMLKEIFEQPVVMGETLNAYYNPAEGSVQMPEMPFALEDITGITIIACGTSYYAGHVAKYWLEQVANVPTQVEIASEFRYRQATQPKGGLTICISQSGETADTLAALKLAKEQGQHILSIINVDESSMTHASDVVLRSYAGPEIGVASTKAFTSQLMVLACFTIAIAEARKAIDEKRCSFLLHALAEVPARAVEILHHDEDLNHIALELSHAQSILYMGRGTSYPIALEGALKLKEISYIHADGIAAGELKHGPIALVDEHFPIVVIAPSDSLSDKTISNVQEVAARGAKVIFLGDEDTIAKAKDVSAHTVEMAKVDAFVTPILYALPIQLLAYHTAVHKGTDVDQPRNLAKSVTVE